MSFKLSSFCVLAVSTMCLSACSKKWNPDEQFSKQKRVREARRVQAQAKLELQAKDNLVEIERKVLVQVRRGMPLTELDQLMGYRFAVLASLPTARSTWETRKYRMGQLVASTWGTASLEYDLCEKDRKLFTVTLANAIVREIEY